MTLNAAQRTAVDSKSALRVLICGPGSGKSRCIIEAAKAVPEGSRVALMTYTQAGAHVFRQRLPADIKLTHCSTLHSYCFKLIQRFGGFLGYITGKVGILPDAERIPRLLQCRDKLGLKVSQKAILERPLPSVDLIWREYEFLLKRSNLVDYDLILKVAYELILKWREVKEAIKLDYLFVDESQDSAAIDWWIYDAIPAANKMFVADIDQSIFQFRGAYPKGLLQMTQRPGAEVHKLELNYRSDTSIADAANRLIAHNRERVEKQIIPVSTEPGVVEVMEFETVAQELSSIAVTASHALSRPTRIPGSPPLSVAVLYRMNHEVKQCRDYLMAMGLPVQMPKFEQRPADWERAMLLLALCASPDNEILTERFLKLDNDVAIVDRWLVESRAAGKALSSYFGSIWSGKGQPSLVLIPQLLAKKGVTEGTVNLIRQRSELLAPDADLSDLIHALHKPEETKENPPDGASEGVVVSTFHAAKGKEYDVCFLCGIEEECFPGRDEMEEARRLLYVGITRARHECYLSWCSHRQAKWGGVQERKPSRFLAEMGLA